MTRPELSFEDRTLIHKRKELDGTGICIQCGEDFIGAETGSLRKTEFCSIKCELAWAEEHGEYVVRARGRFPRIGFIDGGDYFNFPSSPVKLLERIQDYPIDIFTFLQHPARSGVCFDYPMEADNLAVLPISTYEYWWRKQITVKTRYIVQKAKKRGVETAEITLDDELVRAIHEIYNETPVRQGRRYANYGMSLEQVRDLTLPFHGRSIYIGARVQGKIVGFLKMVQDETRAYAGIINILSLAREQDKSPMNALIAHAIRTCAERQISQLSYGHYYYGKKERDGLVGFKIHNGFERLDVPRYYAILTDRGGLAFKLGLHHRWSERIPESVAARLRAMRAWWYGRQFS
jgi:hypothetical protein